MTDIQLKKSGAGTGNAVHPEGPVRKAQLPETERICTPPVDILEGGDGILLTAEMPGVDQQSVEVTVENNVLTIEGNAHVALPEGYELVGQEYAVGRYRRVFTLSDAIRTEGVRARVQHGVLEVTLLKREAEQSKRKTIAIECD